MSQSALLAARKRLAARRKEQLEKNECGVSTPRAVCVGEINEYNDLLYRVPNDVVSEPPPTVLPINTVCNTAPYANVSDLEKRVMKRPASH